MSEEIKKYGKKTTFTNLSKYVFGFCLQKIMRDSDKPDPLTETFDELREKGDDERNERLKAFRIWESSRTEKNAVAVLNEYADEINFLIFQAGKIAQYTEMKRE